MHNKYKRNGTSGGGGRRRESKMHLCSTSPAPPPAVPGLFFLQASTIFAIDSCFSSWVSGLLEAAEPPPPRLLLLLPVVSGSPPVPGDFDIACCATAAVAVL